MGQFIEEVYTNPIKPRGFDINDFAGLLQKYESETAVEYLSVNSDLQYCVTLTRPKLRNAFTSWSNLEEFITSVVNALYNGCYITRFNQTKGLPLAAFNMSKTDFLGRVIVVDDFTQYNDDGTVAVDGSMIKAVICDRAWFKIKTQDFDMEEFRNPNNRTFQLYLNDTRVVNYSLFANAKIYTTEEPTPSGSDS